MLDNLRRTLSAPAAFLTLIAGWTLPFASPVIWTAFVLAAIAIPPLLPVLTGLIPHRRGISKRSHLRAVGTDLVLAAAQVGLTVTLLAHQAWLMTDAIVRTLFRVYVTRQNLLEWMTAAQAKSAFYITLGSVYRWMGGAVVLAAVVAILVPFGPPGAWWLVGDAFSLLSGRFTRGGTLDQPATARGWGSASSADNVRMLRLTRAEPGGSSRTLSAREDHALPPDNFGKSQHQLWPTARRPPTSGYISSPPSLRTISAGLAPWLQSSGSKPRSER
jgi:cyclic beta-1,2-glucan synthetase